MKEVTGNKFYALKQRLHRNFIKGIESKNVSDWVDFIDQRWIAPDGKEYLRRAEQEMYDEVEIYPSRITYYANEELFAKLTKQ